MFKPSNLLQDYLNENPRDMFYVIGALMGYIDADPEFKTDDFDQAVQYVLSHGVSKDELFVEFDSDLKFEEDSTKWDEEYYSFARVYLNDNFSEKRIKHVKEVARKIYPNVVPITTREQQAAMQENDNSYDTTGGHQSTGKKTDGQQHKNHKSKSPIMQEHRTVKTLVLIVIGAIVLLTLVIAFIIIGVKNRMEP